MQNTYIPLSRFQACSNAKRSVGAVLILGLILLLVLTIIGVTAMTTTSLETKMATNYNDRNAAFQAAEARLFQAEQFIETSILLPSQFTADGDELYTINTGPNHFDAFDEATWWTGTASTAGPVMTGAKTAPRALIEIRGVIPNPDANAAINMGGYGETTGAGNLTTFRITARGTGRTDNAQVILQSNYAKLL